MWPVKFLTYNFSPDAVMVAIVEEHQTVLDEYHQPIAKVVEFVLGCLDNEQDSAVCIPIITKHYTHPHTRARDIDN